MKTGVYQIRNLLNGKLYVGSVSHKKGFADRWSKHRTTLRHKKHFNQHLQCAWNKYRQNISNGLQGRTVTTKTRAKISIAQQGELGNNTKLTVVDVCKIKILLQQKESQRNIAKLFGVGQQTISNINMGQTWSHI